MARNATVSVDGKSSVDQGDYFPAQSLGTHTYHVDLDTLFNFWKPTRQLVQVAKDCKWCACCGEVRPKSMFNTVAPDVESFITLLRCIRIEAQCHYRSRLLDDLLHRMTTCLFDWCRSCQMRYAPRTLGFQYCPHCEVGWQPPENFSSSKAQYCRVHQAEVNARRSDKANMVFA